MKFILRKNAKDGLVPASPMGIFIGLSVFHDGKLNFDLSRAMLTWNNVHLINNVHNIINY